MTSGSSRLLWLALFLAGGLLGWILRPTPTPPPAEPASGSSSITVGPLASQLTISKLIISKSENDVVWWNSRDPNRVLWIEFEDQIFQGMGPGEPPQPGGRARFRVKCKDATCFSGNILATALEREYKYWQILSNPNGSGIDRADGWIVIQR